MQERGLLRGRGARAGPDCSSELRPKLSGLEALDLCHLEDERSSDLDGYSGVWCAVRMDLRISWLLNHISDPMDMVVSRG